MLMYFFGLSFTSVTRSRSCVTSESLWRYIAGSFTMRPSDPCPELIFRSTESPLARKESRRSCECDNRSDEELRAFVARNGSRRTVLELLDEAIGAQLQVSGYVLVGASYDRHDRRMTLMFG